MFIGQLADRAAIHAIHFYQRVAPQGLRDACRFHPTCSNYSIMAIEKFGTVKGMAKSVSRLWRCRPPHGGIDLP